MENEYLKISLLIFAVIVGAIILSKILRFILRKYINFHTTKLDNDPTSYNFLQHAISLFVALAALIIIFYSVPPLREIGITILASAGLIAAIIGLAAQQAFANIVSGIFIVIFKPFRVDDLIEINNKRGVVEDITLRHTVIRNIENRRLIIPNSQISSQAIINASIHDSKICNLFEVGISYESNIDKAIDIIRELAEKHPNCIDNRTDSQKEQNEPKVIIRVTGYGDSSINLRAYIWSNDPASGFVLKCDLYKSVKEQFDEHGIEIPYPHRTIVKK